MRLTNSIRHVMDGIKDNKIGGKKMAINISEHLQKDYWKRRTASDKPIRFASATTAGNYRTPSLAQSNFVYLTQEDFMREIEPSAHDINSAYYSKRPVWELVPKKGADGNDTKEKEWRIVRYEDMEVVNLGIQKRLASQKAAHFASKGYWVCNEGEEYDLFNKFESWRDSVGLKTAYLEVVLSCFQTGDGAIYVYQNGNNIEYKVFSYLKGDILYPDIDEDRNPILYRQYTLIGKTAVDVYSTKYVETWVQSSKEDEDKTWYDKIKGWFKGGVKGDVYSDDGYKRIYRNESQTNDGINQCVYFRVDDIPSGVAQESIEALEKACSYMSEEVRSSAYPKLFLKATKFVSLPPLGGNGTTIGVKGNTDDIKNADAKYLTKQDVSNIATLNIETLWDNIVRTTMSVFIEPEIMKQGADSSAAMRLLYSPEVMWSEGTWTQFANPVRQLTEVFKELVGKVEGKPSEFAKLRLSVGLDVYVPTNDAEKVDLVCKMVYAGILSQENARSELGLQYVNDGDIVKRESEEKLYRDNFVPEKAKAEAQAKYGVSVTEDVVVGEKSNDADNGKPKLDKNLQRRDLAEDV